MTVLARLGSTGVAPDSSNRRRCSASSAGSGNERSVRSVNVHDHREALADADAGGRDAVAAAAPAQLPAGVDDHPRSRGAERVTDGNRAAVDIDLLAVDLRQLVQAGQHHRGERLVDLPDGDVGERQPGPVEDLADGADRGDREMLWLHTDGG